MLRPCNTTVVSFHRRERAPKGSRTGTARAQEDRGVMTSPGEQRGGGDRPGAGGGPS